MLLLSIEVCSPSVLLISAKSVVIFMSIFLVQYLFIFLFQDWVSLCYSGCSRTRPVDRVCPKLKDPPSSASQVLGLIVCITTSSITGDIDNSSVWSPWWASCGKLRR